MDQPKLYQRKPTQLEAIQFTGENDDAIKAFGAEVKRTDIAGKVLSLFVAANNGWLDLQVGEWIAKDDFGYYPIKDEQFKRVYEEVQ